MIILDQLSKVVRSDNKTRNVLSSQTIEIPSNRRIALLGSSEDDKRILIELLAGLIMPDAGRIVRKAQLSFPVGQLPGFSKELSIRVNVAHVARLYGANVGQTVKMVERIFTVGKALDRPYGDLPRKMRRPLSQIVAFSLPFDAYLLTDDKLRPEPGKSKSERGEDDFSASCSALFQARMQTSGMIIPTDDSGFAREHCEIGLVLDNGRLKLVDDFSEVSEVPRLKRQRHRRDDDSDD